MIDFHFFCCDKISFETTKHPILIGISVGGKPVPIEMIVEYLKWAEQHSSHTVQILIADDIAKYNYFAFSNYTKPGALSRAIRDGDKHQKQIEKAIASLPSKLQSRFNVIRWSAVRCDKFETLRDAFHTEFENNVSFRNFLLSILNTQIERRGRKATPQRQLSLSEYVLDELPVLLDGIYIEGVNYTTVLYPTYQQSWLGQLTTYIQQEEHSPNIANLISRNKTFLIEAILGPAPI